MFHIALHFIIPALIIVVFIKRNHLYSYGLIMATMLVDIDHLLANPLYDPLRCSIGFHPLHQLPAIIIYLILCFIPKTRIIGVGLIIHMILDSIDCYTNQGIWYF